MADLLAPYSERSPKPDDRIRHNAPVEIDSWSTNKLKHIFGKRRLERIAKALGAKVVWTDG